MVIVSIFVLSFICTLIFTLCIGNFDNWYDFWKIIVCFCACFLTFAIIFVSYVFVYTNIYCKGKEGKGTKFSHRFLKRICELICQVSLVRIHTRGFENIPTDQKFLCVENHLSNYDPITTIWALRCFDFSFLYKNNIDKAKLVGYLLKHDGNLSLDRSNNRRGLETIVKAIRRITNDEASVVVYPEGTRSKTGEIAQFHPGTFKIAEKSHCPIVIIAIENTDAVAKRFPRHTDVYLDFVEVLYYEDYKDMNTVELSQLCHKKIVDRLAEIEALRYQHK